MREFLSIYERHRGIFSLSHCCSIMYRTTRRENARVGNTGGEINVCAWDIYDLNVWNISLKMVNDRICSEYVKDNVKINIKIKQLTIKEYACWVSIINSWIDLQIHLHSYNTAHLQQWQICEFWNKTMLPIQSVSCSVSWQHTSSFVLKWHDCVSQNEVCCLSTLKTAWIRLRGKVVIYFHVLALPANWFKLNLVLVQ